MAAGGVGAQTGPRVVLPNRSLTVAALFVGVLAAMFPRELKLLDDTNSLKAL